MQCKFESDRDFFRLWGEKANNGNIQLKFLNKFIALELWYYGKNYGTIPKIGTIPKTREL